MDFLLNQKLSEEDNEAMASSITNGSTQFYMTDSNYNISLDMLVVIGSFSISLNSSLFKKKTKIILNQGS